MRFPIIVISEGGLGNQLFQAALGVHLKEKFNRRLVFISISNGFRVSRECELRDFGFRVFILPRSLSMVVMALLKIVRKFKLDLCFRWIAIERKEAVSSFEFCPLLVSGYWQKEIYYRGGVSSIRRRAYDLCEELFDVEKKMFCNHNEMLAVHVRRGDYVSDKKVSEMYNVCSLEYYKMAVDSILAEDSSVKAVLVFSDDPLWAKKNLKFSIKTLYVDPVKEPSWSDMIRMSLCQHFVISNSSYSFWAATLGEKTRSIKCAPESWYKGVSTPSLALLGDDWIYVRNDEVLDLNSG